MPIATRTFRVFVSSTFEDLKEERNALQREVFPKLRALSEQHGARFQAIDLRWGVRDEAGLDQQTLEICLRETERCQRTGVKPNFIVLLGDRYGWQPLPARIPAAEFETLRPHLPPGESLTQGDHWYKLDENAVPPEYCLQPRTGEFTDPDAWNRVEQTLHQALAQATRAARLPEAALVKYEASATHQEILAGLGETEADRHHVFGFFRRPTGEPDPHLEELKTYLRDRLPGNIVEFDPGDTARLCGDVLTRLQQVIEEEVKRFEDGPALDLEVEAHNRFAEERCRIFAGREGVLKTIADYLRGEERRPLVLRGESGSGKSAVMAKASQLYKGPGRVIRRFIGASPQSTSGHALLTSLCQEIAPPTTSDVTPVDYAQLENALKERLKVATAEQPLVLIIDALDQLASSDQARDGTWLRPALPPHVKVIVSTLSTTGIGDGERLPEGFTVRLERMAVSEGGQVLDELLQETQRTLQPWQRRTVLAHFERCGLPLYLKLAAEESRLWKSYAPENACTLGEGVAGVIDTLFARLSSESNYGPVLVERSLGYLAAARYGLAEDEILDVLTEDDAAWKDFNERKHHDGSERRLPVVVWSRLSLDLEPYLAERAAPGGTVMTFYHLQLAERVASRFLAGTELQARHGSLARHFGAKLAWLDEGRKSPNARRAVELMFQQRRAQQWTEAEATLFDCQFLFAKCAAGMLMDLDSDYQALLHEAPSELPRRGALELIHGALQLSIDVIAKDSAAFASQMVGRLLACRDLEGIQDFMGKISESAPRPWLRPLAPALTPPGSGLIRVLRGADWMKMVAVSADGKVAISGSQFQTVKVWDLETGRERRTLQDRNDLVLPNDDSLQRVALSANAKVAASAFADGKLKVWDVETGREQWTLRGHTDSVRSIALSADGKLAVSASWDRTLKVWDLETGRENWTLQGHTDPVVGVALSANGRLAISASRDRTLKVWDVGTGRELRTLRGHTFWVYDVAASADGRLAVSASGDHTLKVWDVETGRELQTLRDNDGEVTGVAVSGDGKLAVSASGDTLKVWDVEIGREVQNFRGGGGVSGVAVSANGKLAVSASDEVALKVWDLESLRKRRPIEGHSQAVCGVALSVNGRLAVSGSADHTLKVWDVESGRELHTLRGHGSAVNGVAVSADGKLAVSASGDHTLKVWDLRSGRERRTLQGHTRSVLGVAVGADGTVAISASADDTLKVWDLETGREKQTLRGHTSWVSCVAISADGRAAVSASHDLTLKVWDVERGQERWTTKGHGDSVDGVAISADGRVAVSVSGDRTLKVWDIERQRERRTLTRHVPWVRGVALSAEGEVAVSVSEYHPLKAWAVESGICLAMFSCDGAARCCAIAASVIAAGDGAGRIYLLALEE